MLGVASLALTAAHTTFAYFGAGASGGWGQTRRSAIVEAWMNVAIGFSINFAANFAILPLIGVQHLGAADNFWLGCIYTSVSVVRSYVIRRWFNDRLRRAAALIAGCR